MNAEKIEQYKARLEKERAELIEKIDHDRGEDFGDDVDDAEEADETESFSEKLAINSALRERVNEIDAALAKIREKKFGACENCGKEIEEGVLEISPESGSCKSCKLSRQ